MITPFDCEYGKQHTLETAEGANPVFYTDDLCFKVAMEVAAEDDDGIDCETATQIWASACFYDAVFGGADYAEYCKRYENEYSTVIKKLEIELSKKKLLSKKPVYNRAQILQNAIDALNCIIGIGCECELADCMESDGKFKEWKNEIIDLQNRLSKHIDYEQLAD